MMDLVKRPANPTPMFRQYFDIKDRYPGCILLFRCGDFYEMYGEDAEKGAGLMEIAVTSRDAGGGERIAMAGVPHHAVDNYMRSLIKKGEKVAVCEQLEDPSQAKGLVKRDVTKVITSGTVTDPNLLSQDENNFLMCITGSDENYGMAFCDISTGEFRVTGVGIADYSWIVDEIFRIRPGEAIISKNLRHLDVILSGLGDLNIPYTTSEERLSPSKASEILDSVFPRKSEDNAPREITEKEEAAAMLFGYLNETQKTARHSIFGMEYYSLGEFMSLDSATWRNLELSHTIMERQKKGSLLWVIDQTRTAMGARLLRGWLEKPLLEERKINARLDSVAELKENYVLIEEFLGILKSVQDLERITTRIVYGSANARDLLALRNSIANLPRMVSLKDKANSSLLILLLESLDILEDVHSLIETAIGEDPPVSVKEGNMIKPGFSPDLDELRNIRSGAKEWIAELENTEREKTGIKSLKVKYNNVFGYFIEVTRTNLHLVPQEYMRKQTIANGERFISPELKEYEAKVLGAEEKIIDLEYRLFLQIREQVMLHSERIQKTSRILANIDCLCSLALTARQHNYSRPIFTKESILEIDGGRHPVVEKMPECRFVPNDTRLGDKKNRFHIITGPNMSGKSTYLRQVGLIVIMAHIGSFVPASSARMGIVDRVFTRVGASDNLHMGKSTFMVEMSETANIISNAARRSLILLDEIGRGTSTYDGMSIAWSVSEYIHNRIGARTLFATHFHEMTKLADNLSGVSNYRVDVKETNREIVFLHRIVPGGTDRSYGIYVAKLAGMPNEILVRAKDILDEFENGKEENTSSKKKKKDSGALQLTFFDLLANPLTEELRDIDPDRLTPREALDKLYEWKRKFD
ncbi:MAG: DNA mismatch repair protein MutS [Firmicutes bacterium]|nr:DNA mismatch repair protein MutS [Bacillota bacterium]